MQKIKGYINYSKFGNTVSLEPRCHEEIFDEIEIYVPDKYKIRKTIYEEPLINIDGKDYMMNEIIIITKDDKICIYDMKYAEAKKTYYIRLKYKKIS